MNDKQFEREYMGTFEPRHAALLPPRRSRLAAVLAALTDRPESYWTGSFRDGYEATADNRGVSLTLDRDRVPVDPPLIARGQWCVGTPAEAWELLAARDLIPLSWTDHPRRFERAYHCPHGKLRGCSWCGPGIRTIPSTLAEIVAIASDVVGVETAEAIVGQQFPQHTVLWSVRPKKEIDDRLAEARRGSRQPETPEDKGLAELGYLRWSLMDPYCMVLCPML